MSAKRSFFALLATLAVVYLLITSSVSYLASSNNEPPVEQLSQNTVMFSELSSLTAILADCHKGKHNDAKQCEKLIEHEHDLFDLQYRSSLGLAVCQQDESFNYSQCFNVVNQKIINRKKQLGINF